MNEGWIKVYRQIQDCSIWSTNKPYDERSAWIELLLLANHRDKKIIFNGKEITIKQGQYLTSVRKLADKWNWNKNKTLDYLRLLERLKMIHRDSDKSRTLLTIVNYGIYQGAWDTIGDTVVDSMVDTIGDSSMPQTIKKECKKEINKDIRATNKFVPPTLDEVKAYCSERNNNVDAEKWFDFYESKGWMVGSNKMKNWKAAVRTWEKGSKATPKPKSNKFSDFANKQNYDMSALEKKMLGG